MENEQARAVLEEIKDKYLSLSSGVIDFEKFNFYGIVHHGSSLEGSTLTEEESRLLLDEGLTPKNKPLEHSLMEVDHLAALQYVTELAESKTELNLDHIKRISSLVLKNTGGEVSAIAGNFDTSKGDFRMATVSAGNRMFMDYKKVPDRVSLLVKEINSQLKGCNDFYENSLLAFNVHFQMVSIHPFGDGNGRLSRLMMNYVQHYHKQPLTIVFKEDKGDYVKALEETRKGEDARIFETFMLNQSYKFFDQQVNLLSRDQTQKKDMGRGLTFLF